MEIVEIPLGTSKMVLFSYVDSDSPTGAPLDLTDVSTQATDISAQTPAPSGLMGSPIHLGPGSYGVYVDASVDGVSAGQVFMTAPVGNDGDGVVDHPDWKLIKIVPVAELGAEDEFWTTSAIVKAYTGVQPTFFQMFEANSDVDAAYNIDYTCRDDCNEHQLRELARATLWQAKTIAEEAAKAASQLGSPVAYGVTQTREQDGVKQTNQRSWPPAGQQSPADAVLNVLCPQARRIIENLKAQYKSPKLITSHRPDYGSECYTGRFENKFGQPRDWGW